MRETGARRRRFSLEPMTALLAAHGWLMLLGWFVALPLAAASARFLRPLAAEPSDASWLRSHQRWAYVAALCVLVGLILAVADGERAGSLPVLRTAASRSVLRTPGTERGRAIDLLLPGSLKGREQNLC